MIVAASGTSGAGKAVKAHLLGSGAILNEAQPIVYLYHPKWLWALNSSIKGFTPYPDGMIRLEGVTWEE